jgi:hypothetical protein
MALLGRAGQVHDHARQMGWQLGAARMGLARFGRSGLALNRLLLFGRQLRLPGHFLDLDAGFRLQERQLGIGEFLGGASELLQTKAPNHLPQKMILQLQAPHVGLRLGQEGFGSWLSDIGHKTYVEHMLIHSIVNNNIA